jgi:AcrR family transcriptional regulator
MECKEDTVAADPTAFLLLWERRAMPTRGPKPTLTLEAIATAGIGLADAEGLAALTMHRVAERLDVTKMALYRYVPGKAELVALMVDVGIGEAPRLDEVAGGWRAKLDAWAHRLFERFSGHPWALEATVGARVVGPNEMSWLEQAIAALTGTGLTGSEMLDVAGTLAGHVRTVAQQTGAMGTGDPEQAMNDTFGAVLAGRENRFPALAAALADPEGKGQGLDFGLQCILGGVEPLIDRRASSTR